MDFDDTPDEAAYRAHVREQLEAHAGELLHVGAGEGSADARSREAELRGTQRVLAEAGLIGVTWSREHGGQGGTLVQQAIVAQELARARVPDPDQPHRPGHVRADRHRARQRRPEAALPRPAAARRRRLVPAVQRAGVGLGPRGAAHHRGPRRRGLDRQRAEGLDDAGARRRLRHPAHPHRPRPAQARRADDVRRRHARPRRHRAPAAAAGRSGRLQRGLLRRRPHPRRRAARRAGRGVAGRADHPDERAGDDRRGRHRPRPTGRGAGRARPGAPAGARPRAAGPRPAGGRPRRRRVARDPLHRLPPVLRAQPGRAARPRGQRGQAGRHRGRAAGGRRRGAAARRRRRLRRDRGRRRDLAANAGVPARAGDRRRHGPGAAQHPRGTGARPAAGTARTTRQRRSRGVEPASVGEPRGKA